VHGERDRRERILYLMGQPPGDPLPGGHPLGADEILAARTHAGGAGNLGLGELGTAIRTRRRGLERRRAAFSAALAALTGDEGGG